MASEQIGLKPIQKIEQPKVILAEGRDDESFFRHACKRFGISDTQVFSYKGKGNLKNYLPVLIRAPGFETLETIVISRDADSDADAAMQSVAGLLKMNGLAVPQKPFVFAGDDPRIGIMLCPGYKDQDPSQGLSRGTIEDLCLAMIANSAITSCIDKYMQCITENPVVQTDPSKSRLHAYLAAHKDYAGLKLGEATKAGAWDLGHPSFAPFKNMLLDM